MPASHHRGNRLEVVGWCAYDWANSAFATTVLAAVLPVYFTYVVPAEGIWLGIPGGPGWQTQAPSLWAYAVSVSLALVAFSGPILGSISDHTGSKKKFLLVCALSGAAATALLFFVRQGDVWLCVGLFVVANIGFAGGNIFYNAFLPEIAAPEKLDRVSALGFAAGYLGGGLVLAINLLAIQHPDTFGLSDSLVATRVSFLFVGTWWLVFSLPTFAILKDRPPPPAHPGRNRLITGWRQVTATLRHARAYGQLMRFLLAFLLYNDGIQTTIVMAAIFGRAHLQLSPGFLLATLLFVQVLAIPGALALARLAEVIGVKTTLSCSLLVWVGITLYAAFFLDTPLEYICLSAAVGLVLGGSQSLSRSLYSRFVPPGQDAEFFGFYGLSNKFSSIFGPLLFGAIADISGDLRLSILSISLFFLAGLVLLLRLDVNQGMRQAKLT